MSKCYTEMVATIIEESGRTFFRVRTRLLNLFVPSRFSEVHSTVFPTFHRPTQHFEALIVVMVWETAMKWDFKLICSFLKLHRECHNTKFVHTQPPGLGF